MGGTFLYWGVDGTWGSASVAAVVFTFLVYVFFYGRAARKPTVIGQGPLKKRLLKYCPILKERYWPTFWAFHGHLTTMLRYILQKKCRTFYKREVLTLADGGEVALDWGFVNEQDSVQPSPSQKDLPVLLILPGAFGSSTEAYITHLVHDGILTKYRPVVFNYRGHGGVSLKNVRISCASNIGDLFEVVQYIKSKYPVSKMVAIGISMGGVNLIQYQHRLGKSCDLAAVITCGAMWEPHKSRWNIEERFMNRMIYSRMLTRSLADIIADYIDNLNANEMEKLPELDASKLKRARRVSEILQNMTLPMLGYASLDEYYRDLCNKGKVHKIMTTLVCIAAADDPFVPHDTLPLEEFKANPHTVMIFTSHGGHFGYLEGLCPTEKTWLDRTVVQILEALKLRL